ncbi:DUF998 domain-containing protein, partial [Micromonospora sp. NPDC000207]|uniref:DUF998 domain-containing protein n=1 Tax=Micromonospora sp. NPDC000207 TaxID=3154246 RepID=UPI0033303596
MSLHRLGVVAWLVQPLYLVAEIVTATAVGVPYSFVDNTISDLGASACTTVAYPFGDVAVCSPWHLVLNTAFVVTGVLMVVGALLVRHPVAGGWVRWLWVVAGLSSVGTGLVPLDRDLDLQPPDPPTGDRMPHEQGTDDHQHAGHHEGG